MGAQAKKSSPEQELVVPKRFPKIIYRKNGPPILAPLGKPSIPEEKIWAAVAKVVGARKAKEKAEKAAKAKARTAARAKKT